MSIMNARPPSGFHVATAGTGDFTIRYRTRGMRSLRVFYIGFLALWTFASFAVTAAFLSGRYIFLPFVVVWWLVEFGIGGWAIWHSFSVLELVLESDRLVVQQTLWWWRRGWIVQRRNIRAVTQVKDGGEGDDDFPSWGLKIDAAFHMKRQPDRVPALVRYGERPEADSVVTILSQQPIEKSDWLGPIVAQWAGVSFDPVAVRR